MEFEEVEETVVEETVVKKEKKEKKEKKKKRGVKKTGKEKKGGKITKQYEDDFLNEKRKKKKKKAKTVQVITFTAFQPLLKPLLSSRHPFFFIFSHFSPTRWENLLMPPKKRMWIKLNTF